MRIIKHKGVQMTLYMKVTDDEYELPLVVADTKSELARIVGVRHIRIRNGCRRSIYARVTCDDED